MKIAASFLRDTIVGGVMFLVPIVVIVAILGKAHQLSIKIVTPLAEAGVGAPRLLAIVLIVLFCTLSGLFARTRAARRTSDFLEGTILSRIPGYTLMKGMAEGLLGAEGAKGREPVLVRIEDAWQIALLMERVEPGHVAVYIPGSPDPRSGDVFILTEDRIRPLDVPLKSALDSVKNAGKGSNAMLRGKL